jgi:hypothetical protein
VRDVEARTAFPLLPTAPRRHCKEEAVEDTRRPQTRQIVVEGAVGHSDSEEKKRRGTKSRVSMGRIVVTVRVGAAAVVSVLAIVGTGGVGVAVQTDTVAVPELETEMLPASDSARESCQSTRG